MKGYLSMKKHAFTMAEILISLTIIGVIAAITLPALRANINENTWNTQRKALYTRISQAISMMGSLNGYGVSTDDAETNANATMVFVTEGLNKVLKINNICDKDHLSKCGLPNNFTTLTNSTMSFPTNLYTLNTLFNRPENPQRNINTDAVAFETANYESVVVLYNPLCKSETIVTDTNYSEQAHPFMCANFIYDLNGKKGPNKFGKDIGFITALYPEEPSIVAPMPLATDANNGNRLKGIYAAAACEAQDSDSRLPNADELLAMSYNSYIFGRRKDDSTNHNAWSSSLYSPSYRFSIQFGGIVKNLWPNDSENTNKQSYVRCIKR